MTVYDYAPTLSNLFDEETCQKIENKSRAVIIRDDDCRLIIQGSDQLHVLMALSIVEDIAARFETNVSDPSRRRSSAKHDLDKVLERAYSRDDEADDTFDWSIMPEEVKRAILVSLCDSDVPEVIELENITEEQTVGQETVPVQIITTGVSSSNSEAAATSTVSNMSIAAASKVPVVDLSSKLYMSDPTVQPLVKLATSKGYSQEEIETVLSKNNQWKESEFLRTLHTNRRIRSATCQQPSDSIPRTSQQPTVSKNVHACRDGADIMEVVNDELVESRDVCIDVDEVNAADLSVILLRSDHEMESSDDHDFDKEDSSSRLAESAEHTAFPTNGALPNKQVQKNAAAQSSASRQPKKNKKRKRNKRKSSPNAAVQEKDRAPDVIKTGTDINDLDPISMIPSAPAAAIDVSSDVVVVDDSSDSDVEVPEIAASMKLVVGRKERRQTARQNKERDRSPVLQPSSTSSHSYVSESHSNTRQPDFLAPASASVPTDTPGSFAFKCGVMLLSVGAECFLACVY